MIDTDKLKVGDILSESSHYKVQGIYGSEIVMTHFESNTTVTLNELYVKNLLHSGDEFSNVVEVTKEDKKDGTPGIRTIFENIHGGQVFTVCFKKQDKPKSKKKMQEEIDAIVNMFSEKIDKVKSQKKGVSDAAKALVNTLINKPVLPYEKGEDRILRGYKIQFTSRDGRYDCVDMDIERTEKESGIRPCNINTIKWLIYNGVKYVVK